MALMKQTWQDLLFIHQEVCAESLKKVLPNKLELDLHQGQAYISFVPFLMKDIRPLSLPSIPYLSSMKEFNLRTYVKYKDQKAVYFFSLDATKTPHIEIARTFFKLNYLKASISYDGNKQVESIRTDSRDHECFFKAKFHVKNDIQCKDELTLWLTERYSYLSQIKDKVYQGKLDHPAWQLKEVQLESIEENYLEKYQITPKTKQYLCHFADEMRVDIKSFKTVS